jgi:two-component system response regulator HydG
VLKENDKIIGSVETLTDITELLEKDSQIEAFRKELQSENTFEGMIGVSVSMRRIFSMITNIAESDAPALIIGETFYYRTITRSIFNGISASGSLSRLRAYR